MSRSKQSLISELDGIVRTVVLLRDGNRCQKCRHVFLPEDLHSSHVIVKKGHLNIRHDLNNVLTMCAYCHLEWWHKHPEEAMDWFADKFPDRYEYLMERKNGIYKVSIGDLREVKKGLLDEKGRLEQGRVSYF